MRPGGSPFNSFRRRIFHVVFSSEVLRAFARPSLIFLFIRLSSLIGFPLYAVSLLPVFLFTVILFI